jgi:hypothetical protein
MGEAPLPDRPLDEAHFEFRGDVPAERVSRGERSSDSSR